MTIQDLLNSEVDESFIQHMKDSMCMSYFKYGHINNYASNQSLDYINKELKAFNEDHNTEHMVNVANYAMIRYMLPKSNEHYNATDSNKSTHNIKEQSVIDWLREDLLNNN